MKKSERCIQQIKIFYSQVYIFKTKQLEKKEGKPHSTPGNVSNPHKTNKSIKLESVKPLGALIDTIGCCSDVAEMYLKKLYLRMEVTGVKNTHTLVLGG